MKKKMSSTAIVFKVGISVAFFAVLLSFVQGNELLAMLDHIDWFYFTLSFLLVPVMLSTSCLKWKSVLDVKEQKIPFLSLIRIYLIGYFFSNLLPSNVGGDVVRSFYAGKIIENQAYSAVSVFVERFTGILFLIVLVILAPLLDLQLYRSPYIYMPSFAAFVLLCVIFWVWTVREPLVLPDRVMSFLLEKIKNFADLSGISLFQESAEFLVRLYEGLLRRLQKFHDELNTAIRAIRRDRILFFKIIVLTVFFYFLTWVNVYISFRAFNVRPEFWAVSALVPTILFVAHLPVTVLGNLGFFESVFVFYFLQIDIPPAESLAMGLLLRVKMLSLGIVGYLVYLSYKYFRSSELEQLEQFARVKKEKETEESL